MLLTLTYGGQQMDKVQWRTASAKLANACGRNPLSKKDEKNNQFKVRRYVVLI